MSTEIVPSLSSTRMLTAYIPQRCLSSRTLTRCLLIYASTRHNTTIGRPYALFDFHAFPNCLTMLRFYFLTSDLLSLKFVDNFWKVWSPFSAPKRRRKITFASAMVLVEFFRDSNISEGACQASANGDIVIDNGGVRISLANTADHGLHSALSSLEDQHMTIPVSQENGGVETFLAKHNRMVYRSAQGWCLRIST